MPGDPTDPAPEGPSGPRSGGGPRRGRRDPEGDPEGTGERTGGSGEERTGEPGSSPPPAPPVILGAERDATSGAPSGSVSGSASSSAPPTTPIPAVPPGADTVRRGLRAFVERWLRRLVPDRSREAAGLVASAVLIGALAGLGAVGFDAVLRGMEGWIAWLEASVPPAWAIVAALAIPAAGGLLVGPIVTRWAPDVRGSGIPHVMVAVSNLAGRLPKRIVLWRPLASALSVGTGAPLGTEGPVVQLSAGIASLASGAMRLSAERRRNLLAVAAAGGISATFNAPIAGMLFALEVILGEFGSRYVASVVIGSVTASVVSRAFLGPAPAFAVPEAYGMGSPAELPLYFLMAILIGLAAAAVTRGWTALDAAADALAARVGLPPLARPAAAGLLVGVVGLALPLVLGRGFDTTGRILQGELTGLGLLLALAVVKAVATGVALAGWHSGGVFAPVLFIGAALGGAFGQVAAGWLPAWGLEPGAFALVGMAALLSGATRAPMSSLIMVFEMSNDYRLILPLLLATVVALLVAEMATRESVYQAILTRRGQVLLRQRSADLLQTVRVGEMMDVDAPCLHTRQPLADLVRAIATSHHHGFAVVDPDEPTRLRGIVTLSDLERLRAEGATDDTPVEEAMTRGLHVALPDDAISDVAERMARFEVGRMPVVDPADRSRLVGFVRRSDLARAYFRALERERGAESSAESRRLRDLTGQEVVEVRVRGGCRVAGDTLREARLPKWCIVVAIRRGGRTLFPHGDTRLEPGDVVIANVEPGRLEEFREIFERRGSAAARSEG